MKKAIVKIFEAMKLLKEDNIYCIGDYSNTFNKCESCDCWQYCEKLTELKHAIDEIK